MCVDVCVLFPLSRSLPSSPLPFLLFWSLLDFPYRRRLRLRGRSLAGRFTKRIGGTNGAEVEGKGKEKVKERGKGRKKERRRKGQRWWTVLIGRLHFMRWTGLSCNWSPLNCRSLGNCPFFAPTVTTTAGNKPRGGRGKKIYPLSPWPLSCLYTPCSIIRHLFPDPYKSLRYFPLRNRDDEVVASWIRNFSSIFEEDERNERKEKRKKKRGNGHVLRWSSGSPLARAPTHTEARLDYPR